jgi:hypothetical protein
MALMVARRAATAPEMAAGEPPELTDAGASTGTSDGADVSWVLGAFALVIVAAVVGWLLYEAFDPKYVTAAGFTAFAPLYILAQSIERLLEPFTKYLGSATAPAGSAVAPATGGSAVTKETAVQGRNQAVAAMLAGTTVNLPAGVTPAQVAADWQALLEQVRRNRAVIAWGLASAIGMLACGALGIRLLFATGYDVTPAVDIIVTGLAVGSGTKPLHDLISNIQKSKTDKADPAEAATAS